MSKQYVIWQNTELDIDDFRADYPDCTDDELYERMYDDVACFFDDERANLNKVIKHPILVIADIGRWDGRYNGYKELASGNIADCLDFERDCDFGEWYLDENGDFRSTQHHHDGTHYLLYREWKSGVSAAKREAFLWGIYNGTATEEDYDRYTKRLGDYIAAVYGWELERPNKRAAT